MENPTEPDADAATGADAGTAAPPPDDAPKGGDEVTADQLEADNAIEEDQLKALDPMGDPA